MVKGRFFWKKEWYSICSMHREYNPDCSMCKSGSWQNILLVKLDSKIFDLFPRFWRFMANLKHIVR